MKLRLLAVLASAAVIDAIAGNALAAGCKLESVELPVYMEGLQPQLKAAINGSEVWFLLDSGAMYSVIAPSAAETLKLPIRGAPQGLEFYAVDGRTEIHVTKVERFKLGNTALENIDFIVAGEPVGESVIGLLGQNFLGASDIEYDLANGSMRFDYPNDDCKKARLAYWATSEQVFELKLDLQRTQFLTRIGGVAQINGEKMRVVFDTGAELSILTMDAAKRIGLTPDGHDVVPGPPTRGIKGEVAKAWAGRVRSFSIGGEEISNTRLRFGEIQLADADMLIGADFFLAHRMYVARSQGKIYFTYNGGPVFDLWSSDATTTQPSATAGEEPATQEHRAQLASADAYARRGAAYLARNDFQHAAADFTRATELEPGAYKYFQQRGLAKIALGQVPAAVDDFNEAVRLNPDAIDARMLRARLGLAKNDLSAVEEDLGAVSKIAPDDGNVRLEVARMYLALREPAPAVPQLNRWIASHGQSPDLHEVLNERCWARALIGTELEMALADCDAALKLKPGSAEYLDSRGLVHLRLGNLDKALADYTAALAIAPKSEWSLYGRGLAWLRKGDAKAGNADIDAAKAISAAIEDEAKGYGLAP